MSTSINHSAPSQTSKGRAWLGLAFFVIGTAIYIWQAFHIHFSFPVRDIISLVLAFVAVSSFRSLIRRQVEPGPSWITWFGTAVLAVILSTGIGFTVDYSFQRFLLMDPMASCRISCLQNYITGARPRFKHFKHEARLKLHDAHRKELNDTLKSKSRQRIIKELDRLQFPALDKAKAKALRTEFQKKARVLLETIYRDDYKKTQNNATAIRRIMKVKELPGLPTDRAQKILAFYREQGASDLKALYDKAITNYKAFAPYASPKARDAILALLKLAKARKLTNIKVKCEADTKRIQKYMAQRARFRRRMIEPIGPSFTPRRIASREAGIRSRINSAFRRFIPYKLLNVSRRSSPIVFQVDYQALPIRRVYASRRAVIKKYYIGVGFAWDMRLTVDGKELFRLKMKSLPKSRFTVRRSTGGLYGKLNLFGNLATSSVYDKMAITAFDDFSLRLLEAFGVLKKSRPTRRRRRRR